VQARAAVDGRERAIADYVAGMTDRFALAEHALLQGEA
jgi:dGTP triphosphohydrolase